MLTIDWIVMPPNTTLDFSPLYARLQKIYPDHFEEAFELLRGVVAKYAKQLNEKSAVETVSETSELNARWDSKDVVMITYGDQIRSQSANPLQTLLKFLSEHNLFEQFNTVHFLPCFPFSSDDGFSVIDYRQIDPDLGSWDDVKDFRTHCQLMLDFVVNHISQESEWFQSYLRGEAPYDKYFIEADPNADISAVTRPRSLPLLSDFETSRGKRWLWTTFSRDQLDLNYAEPAVLVEVIDILLDYISRGARIIRLDAIAYLWKQLGTSCIHLPPTHEVVKLFRDVVDLVAPHVLILTETNVPHQENVSYFGDGDEAHMVYQFSLPPLILDAFLNEDALPLKRWVSELESPPDGATYFNFTASHDGVGVRPLEGNVSDKRLQTLVAKIKNRGGLVGTRRQPDGTDSPYELNISYVDALACDNGNVEQHARRFLASQAVMLSMQGVPAVYFHSLVGTQNDLAGVEASDIPRRINRRKFELDELNRRLASDTLHKKIFSGMQRLISIRIKQPAFHPDSQQQYLDIGSNNVLCFERFCESGQRILVAVNFSDEEHVFDLPHAYQSSRDLLAPEREIANDLHLEPAQVAWLETSEIRA